MKLNYTKLDGSIRKRFNPQTLSWIFFGAFAALILIELTNTITNTDNSKYFVDDKSAVNGKLIFNSSIIEKYYDGLSSIPYNYLTSFSPNKQTNTFRVFLIGEASLSGWPYSEEHSIKNKLDRLFADEIADKKVELISISYAGFNTSQAVDLIPQLFQFNPDLIIIYSGHNEFYGYEGYSAIAGKSKLFLIDFVESLFKYSGITNLIRYDNKCDDLEVLLVNNSERQIITSSQKEYIKIKNQFLSNINKIISLCIENKTQLVLTVLSDNYFLPPLGVQSKKHEISADIIFNNARMALLRDGNQNSAVKLFKKTKDADALRLRIPEDFMDDLKKIPAQDDIFFADVKTNFACQSPNEIPGNDLFLDYIHPNLEGLNIIASVYAQVILESLEQKSNTKTDIKHGRFQNTISKTDSILAKERIEKSLAILRSFAIDQYYFESGIK